MRHQLRVHLETREGLGQIEDGIRILTRDEELGCSMYCGDGIGVIGHGDDASEPDQSEGRKHKTARDRIARRWPDTHMREKRQHEGDHDRQEIVGREAGGAHGEVPVEERGHGRDRGHAEADASQAIGRMDARGVDEHRYLVRKSEHRRGQHGRGQHGDAARREDAERGRPQRERSDGERAKVRRRAPRRERGSGEVRRHAQRCGLERDRGRDVDPGDHRETEPHR